MMLSDIPGLPLQGLKRPFVILEDRLAAKPSAMLYRDPVEIIRCDALSDVPAALAALEAALGKGLHAAGFFSYELGYAFEPRLEALQPVLSGGLLMWFGVFKDRIAVPAEQVDRHFAALPAPPPLRDVHSGFERDVYVAKAQRVLDYLDAGDAYQVNVTFPMSFRYDGDPLALYAAMRVSQPVQHGGVVALEDRTIISVSPELFIGIADGRITTRPMKGTVPRGQTAEADRVSIETLVSDPKQRAENLMIVDLLRNDLSRVTVPGSVEVPALFSVETYPTLHTLTSTITAELVPGTQLHDILAAVFPCGSITGAPKLRAMEIIRELEPVPRGVYTGAIGAFSPDGGCSLNVAIRTASVMADGSGRYGVGGGIVADSVPADEYQECLLKARVLTDLAADYGLIETLRWSPTNGMVRGELHLDRLCQSARELGFKVDRQDIARQLIARAEQIGPNADLRMRVELRREGEAIITSAPLGSEPERPLRVGIATVRLDAGDPFLRHKTTRRQIYERAFAEAEAQGLDEVVFLNRRGEVTEAARNTIFVERDGVWVTPPLAAGLLPGVLRQELLARGEAVEGTVFPEDLRCAARWALGNSLRGLRVAHLDPAVG